jgi:hypothetical protein
MDSCGPLRTRPRSAGRATPKAPRRFGGLWPGAAGRAAVGESPRAPRAAGSGLRQAAGRVIRWLHVARGAAGGRSRGEEALLRYVLRPPVAQERVEQRPFGLVRITLKKAYADGTIAVEWTRCRCSCRLATRVPPRLHTLRYAGVLAPANRWRSRLAPQPPQAAAAGAKPGRPDHAGGYRPVGGALGAYHRRGCARLSHLPRAESSMCIEGEADGEGDPEGNLAASAVSGQAPPAGQGVATGQGCASVPRAGRSQAGTSRTRISR